MGRTQLEDAVPMTLGQTFHGFASILRDEIVHLNEAAEDFDDQYGCYGDRYGYLRRAGLCRAVHREHRSDHRLEDPFDGRLGRRYVRYFVPGRLRFRHEACRREDEQNLQRPAPAGFGPRCGLAEFNLPARQPGSSIMPGKVNPVIPEVMNQIAYKVIGNELCVTMSGEAAQMELNAMEPVMAQCDFESAELLMNGFDTLRTLCVDGITANRERCADYVKNSIGVVTALNPIIGYKNSTKIAKEALATGRGVYDLVLEHGILSKEELDTILKPENMIRPVKLNIKPRK